MSRIRAQAPRREGSLFPKPLGYVFVASIVAAACLDDPVSSGSVPEWETPPASIVDHQLAVWASPYSVAGGDTLDVFVHATRGPVSVAVLRLGWYGGVGGQRVWGEYLVRAGRQPLCTPPFPGPVQCPWTRTLRVQVNSSWVSGVYLIKVVDQSGAASGYPFVVKSNQRADFLAIVPQFTWQAYNRYGGSSLYTGDSTGARVHFVSFERPYSQEGWGAGPAGNRLGPELRVIRWLERSGYDVTYESDLDLTGLAGTNPAHAPYHGLIFLGHDEYWTWAEYDRVQELRDAGTHLVFFAANNAYWNIRLSPGAVTGRSGHVITCYKIASDPGATRPEDVTTRFRDQPLNRPENGLYGVMYQQLAIGRGPLVVSDSGVGSEARAFLAAANLKAGDRVPNALADEGDQIANNGRTPPSLQVLFRSPIIPLSTTGLPPFYYTTFFIAPSGAGVFASGSNRFGVGLEDRPETTTPLARLTKSVLDWMLGGRRSASAEKKARSK